MKAWSVLEQYEHTGVIVFAETVSEAKTVARGVDPMWEYEWTDLRVKRLPELDGKLSEPGVVDWFENTRIYYEAGWWPEQGAPECDHCGRYEYEGIPESHVEELVDHGCLCVMCRKAAGIETPEPVAPKS